MHDHDAYVFRVCLGSLSCFSGSDLVVALGRACCHIASHIRDSFHNVISTPPLSGTSVASLGRAYPNMLVGLAI